MHIYHPDPRMKFSPRDVAAALREKWAAAADARDPKFCAAMAVILRSSGPTNDALGYLLENVTGVLDMQAAPAKATTGKAKAAA